MKKTEIFIVPSHIFECHIPDLTGRDYRELVSRYNFATGSFEPVILSNGTKIQPIHEPKTGPSEFKYQLDEHK